MPNPDSKLPQESQCEIKLACSGHNEERKKKVCEKVIEYEEAKEADKVRGCKSGVEEQATLNKKPCDKNSGIACHLARPVHTCDPKSRIDKAKPGCINFESCEEDEDDDELEQEEVKKLKTGCLDYENCKEYEKEERRRLKQEEKQRKKNR